MRTPSHPLAITLGIGLAAGLLNGLLAVGGTLLVPAMVHLLHLDQRRSQATSLWVILPTSVVSLVVYLSRHGVDLPIGWKIAAGGTIGAVLGALLLEKLSSLWLKRIFAGFMMLAALRMVLG